MRVAKITGTLTAAVTLGAALWFMVVSLNRWQWNRTLFFGLIALAAIVVLATGAILHRIGRLEDRLTQLSRQSEVDPVALAALEESRPPRRHRFDWLAPDRTNVFIGFLIGAGVVLSALAWVVDRVAARTTTPAGEHRLARELAAIGYPDGGFVVDRTTAAAQSPREDDDEALRVLLGDHGHGG